MWTYVLAFTKELSDFVMVRSRKRGGWEMPGGRKEPGETHLQCAMREFQEETGFELITDEGLGVDYKNGRVYFGHVGEKIGEPDLDEILEVDFMNDLPDDLAYPTEEYRPLLELARKRLC